MNDTESLRISRELLSHKATDLLRRRIISGELPAGTRLVEDELAAQMGTSRGPLRDAFSLLAREGLVVTTRGKGTYVRGLSPSSVRQLYDVRILLESYAVELATERIGERQAQELAALADRMAEAARAGNRREYVRFDEAIHRRIWELSGNEHLVNTLEYVIVPCLALIALNAEEDEAEWPVVVDFHQALVRAVVAGRSGTARQILRESLADSLGKALAALGKGSAAADGEDLSQF